MNTTNIMIVGVGGQGTLLASRILGNVAISQGYEVKVSEVHGMSQRGGSVVTYVKFGREVASPIIGKGEADIILAFELLEAYRALPYLKVGGKLIVNRQSINPMPVITGAAKYPENIAEKLTAQADVEKFAGVCLSRMPTLTHTIIDLPQQCRLAKENPQLSAVQDRLKTAPVNWLDPTAMPATVEKTDLVWMSQFLDCFSPDEAVSILTRMKTFLKPGGRIAILECLWDRQKYPAAQLSLVCTSLYFTAMANGNSRFFSDKDLRDILARAGLTIESEIDNLGVSHTLFVCRPV